MNRYNNSIIFALSRRLSGSKTLKFLKRLLFQQSHLSTYLPIMKEQLPQKILRLYQDQSTKPSDLDNIQDNLHLQKQHKKSQTLGSMFEEVNIISTKSIDPLNNYLMAWYVFVFIAIIFTFSEVGMMIVYGQTQGAWQDSLQNSGFITFRIYSIIIFFIDIIVQLNTGFLYRGMIIMNKIRILSRYIRYYLIIDILLIIILILALAIENYYINYIRLIVCLKFIRMLEFDQFYIRKLSRNVLGKTLYVIGKQFITIFILSHTIGLIFYVIDYALVNDTVCIENNSLCWLYSATAYSPIISFDWQLQYFYTLYWGVNTIATISYGDIAPNNPQQTWYALYMMCFGFVIYGYVVNNIIKIILWAQLMRDRFRIQLIIYTTYMDNLKINREVQYEVRDYIEYWHLTERNRNFVLENQMKAKLPEDLRLELMKSAYNKLANNIQYILLSSPSVSRLLFYIEEKNFTQNQQILMQGAPMTKMYYLHRGQVKLSCKYNRKIYNISVIKSIDQFIALYQFILNERSSFDITSSKQAVFYFINKDKIYQQVEKYTDLRQNLKLVEYQLRFDHNYQRIFYKCYYCNSNHHWYKCPEIFPNFSNLILGRRHFKEERQRLFYSNHKTWRDRLKLKQLQAKRVKFAHNILRRVQERIYVLRRIKEKDSYLQVDSYYEWAYYKKQSNLSRFKQEWNKRFYRKSLQPDVKLPFQNLSLQKFQSLH